jgi:hypothetical protein
LKDAKSSILDISWHLFPGSGIFFYDLIFVFSTLPGKWEYFEDKKCTKLTPEELKAIVFLYRLKESSYGHASDREE